MLSMLAQPGANAVERLEMDETQIKGSSESPTILYMVPWNSEIKPIPIKPPQLNRPDNLLEFIDPKDQTRSYQSVR